MTSPAFESMRLIAIIVAVLLKFTLMPMYLQSYLNLAVQRFENQKKEAGRIKNVDLQRKVSMKQCILDTYLDCRNSYQLTLTIYSIICFRLQ